MKKRIQASKQAGASEVRVIGRAWSKLVRQVVEPMGVACYVQDEQLGTAHAVRCAKPETIEGDVVIMNGDHPLIEASDIKISFCVFRDENVILLLSQQK